MESRDSNDDFTFTIEGKEYTISEKNNTSKSQKQNFHVPSLTIGAIISVICIAGVFFGVTGLTESSEPLVEKQLDETVKPKQISINTFIDNGSPILGDVNAKITIIEFGDYQCHFCNVYYHNTEHRIFQEYVMTGKVNVIFKDYTIIGNDSITAANAAHCASEQNRFWDFHNTLYENWDGENNGWAGKENMLKFGSKLGLDMNEFMECNADMKYQQKISASNTDAKNLGITGTPAFFIISNDENQTVHRITGAQPYEVFVQIFDSMLEN